MFVVNFWELAIIIRILVDTFPAHSGFGFGINRTSDHHHACVGCPRRFRVNWIALRIYAGIGESHVFLLDLRIAHINNACCCRCRDHQRNLLLLPMFHAAAGEKDEEEEKQKKEEADCESDDQCHVHWTPHIFSMDNYNRNDEFSTKVTKQNVKGSSLFLQSDKIYTDRQPTNLLLKPFYGSKKI